MAFQKVYNHLNGEYKVKVTDHADGKIQHMVIDDGTGTIITTFGTPLVTLTHTRPSVDTATSTSVLAANSSRKIGGWIQNNSGSDFWLEIGAAAVASQGIRVYGNGGVFNINTTQEIRAIQSSGGTLYLDVYEAT